MRDELFGHLEWSDDELWVGAFPMTYVRQLGDEIIAGDEDGGDDPLSPFELARAGKILLNIDVGGKRKKPAAPQRLAWERVVAAGDGAWDEMLDRIVAEYQLQRPARVRWWKSVFGDYRLDQKLPDVKDRDGMKRLVFPFHFLILPAKNGKGPADLGVYFMSTWCEEGFGVRIQNGRMTELGYNGLALRNMESHFDAKIEFPGLGRLARPQEKGAWLARVRCEPFTAFQAVATDRAAFWADPSRFERPKCKVDWFFARGEFNTWVHAQPGELPTKRQADALALFKANEEKNVASVVDAIFDYYNQTFDDNRRQYRGSFLEDAIPKLKSSDGLRELTELSEINVFPDEGTDVGIGFVFFTTWTSGPGLGVRWRAGRVEEVGPRKIARPSLHAQR